MGFDKLHQKSEHVILTAKNANNINLVHERAKREEDNEKAQSDRASNATTYVFGEQCAAFFDSVYYFDQSNLQTSTYVYLPIKNMNNSFECTDLNGTQILTINFENNTGIAGSSVDSLK